MEQSNDITLHYFLILYSRCFPQGKRSPSIPNVPPHCLIHQFYILIKFLLLNKRWACALLKKPVQTLSFRHNFLYYRKAAFFPLSWGFALWLLVHRINLLLCSGVSAAWPGTRACVQNCLLPKLPLTSPLGEISCIYWFEIFGKLPCRQLLYSLLQYLPPESIGTKT